MIELVRGRGLDLPIVIYLMNLDPSRGTPAGAFGITNRPDTLFQLVMDALERRGPISTT